MQRNDILKYIITFIITASIFGSLFFLSSLLSQKRIDEMRSIQDKITIDLLSSETQFALLKQASCAQDVSSMLTQEISRLGERLEYMEEHYGADDPNVVALKKNYSLLLIKDYLLLAELSKKCDYHPVVITYFYNGMNCEDCRKQNYVFSALRETYPEIRVYPFDASLDLSAMTTLLQIYKVPAEYPAYVIGEKVYTGYKTVEELEKQVPAIKALKDKYDREAAQKKAAEERAKAVAEKPVPKEITPSPVPPAEPPVTQNSGVE